MAQSVLIVYFSRAGNNYGNGTIVDLPEGNTEVVAKMIQERIKGETFQIRQVRPYPDDYSVCMDEAQNELQANVRPELIENLDSLEEYDTIILGYPNWWGTMPMPVWTFLESHDLGGKTILPFCTHEGSGLSNSERDIQKLCPNTKVKKGLPILGSSVTRAGKDLHMWLQANELI